MEVVVAGPAGEQVDAGPAGQVVSVGVAENVLADWAPLVLLLGLGLLLRLALYT